MKTYKYAEGQPCPCGSTIGKDHYCRDCGFGCDPDAPCGDGIMSDAVEILHRRYIKGDPARQDSLQAERDSLKTPMTDERLEELKVQASRYSDYPTNKKEMLELIHEIERLRQ